MASKWPVSCRVPPVRQGGHRGQQSWPASLLPPLQGDAPRPHRVPATLTTALNETYFVRPFSGLPTLVSCRLPSAAKWRAGHA